MTNDTRLAVLIDAENVSYKYISSIIAELGKYGTPTIKRTYGNWTGPNLSGWKDSLNDYAITPIQQFDYTRGKNSSDSALIIDAMDILYSKNVDGFCLISSDSDYTRLATRLRESGMFVIGMGERKTPKPFISACEKFTYLEVIGQNNQNSGSARMNLPATAQYHGDKLRQDDLIELITSVVNDSADEDGWAFLSEIKQQIIKRRPDFDERNYGYTKMTPLIKSLGLFELDCRPNSSNPALKLIYIRFKA